MTGGLDRSKYKLGISAPEKPLGVLMTSLGFFNEVKYHQRFKGYEKPWVFHVPEKNLGVYLCPIMNHEGNLFPRVYTGCPRKNSRVSHFGIVSSSHTS